MKVVGKSATPLAPVAESTARAKTVSRSAASSAVLLLEDIALPANTTDNDVGKK